MLNVEDTINISHGQKEMNSELIIWKDVLSRIRDLKGAQVCYLTDNELLEVVYILLHMVDHWKSSENLLQQAIRQSDAFIEILFEDEVYSLQGVPNKIKADKFLEKFVSARRKNFKELLQNGQKVSVEHFNKVFHKIKNRQGMFEAIQFSLFNFDLVDTSAMPVDNCPLSEEQLASIFTQATKDYQIRISTTSNGIARQSSHKEATL